MWLEDEGYLENEEVETATEKAKEIMRTVHDARTIPKEKRESKPRTHKVSDTKKELFTLLLQTLQDEYDNVKVEKENKLILIEVDGKVLKVDLIETREKKK
jgi:uncharacterized protein YdaT